MGQIQRAQPSQVRRLHQDANPLGSQFPVAAQIEDGQTGQVGDPGQGPRCTGRSLVSASPRQLRRGSNVEVARAFTPFWRTELYDRFRAVRLPRNREETRDSTAGLANRLVDRSSRSRLQRGVGSQSPDAAPVAAVTVGCQVAQCGRAGQTSSRRARELDSSFEVVTDNSRRFRAGKSRSSSIAARPWFR